MQKPVVLWPAYERPCVQSRVADPDGGGPDPVGGGPDPGGVNPDPGWVNPDPTLENDRIRPFRQTGSKPRSSTRIRIRPRKQPESGSQLFTSDFILSKRYYLFSGENCCCCYIITLVNIYWKRSLILNYFWIWMSIRIRPKNPDPQPRELRTIGH